MPGIPASIPMVSTPIPNTVSKILRRLFPSGEPWDVAQPVFRTKNAPRLTSTFANIIDAGRADQISAPDPLKRATETGHRQLVLS